MKFKIYILAPNQTRYGKWMCDGRPPPARNTHKIYPELHWVMFDGQTYYSYCSDCYANITEKDNES